jgi:hypothetical protein
MKEELRSSETWVLTRSTRRNIREDTILHSHSRENLQSYKKWTCTSTPPRAFIVLLNWLGTGTDVRFWVTCSVPIHWDAARGIRSPSPDPVRIACWTAQFWLRNVSFSEISDIRPPP